MEQFCNDGIVCLAVVHLEARDALGKVCCNEFYAVATPVPDVDAFGGCVAAVFGSDGVEHPLADADDFVTVGGGRINEFRGERVRAETCVAIDEAWEQGRNALHRLLDACEEVDDGAMLQVVLED